MLPFSIELKPGLPIAEQVVFAVKKAVVGGQLKPGQPFPSVRVVSQELKINPNTAHKIVAALKGRSLLSIEPVPMRPVTVRFSPRAPAPKASLARARIEWRAAA